MSAYGRSYSRHSSRPRQRYDVERFLEAPDAGAGDRRDARLKLFGSPAVPASARRRPWRISPRGGRDDFGRRLLDPGAGEAAHPGALRRSFRAIRVLHDRDSGVVSAKVTVAAAVGEEERRKIGDALGRRLNRKVRVELGVDETILGGFVAKVGSEIFDASVRHAIERFQKQSKEGAGA